MGTSSSHNTESKLSNVVNNELLTQLEVSKKVHKILLLGAGNAGKSTIFKQLHRIYGENNIQEEKQYGTRYIHHSIIHQMTNIIESCKEEHEFKLDDETEKSVQLIEKLTTDKPINLEIANHLTKLWNDRNIKITFSLRSNLGIADSIPYFLDNINRISEHNYIPTEKDIILAYLPTTGIRESTIEIEENIFKIFDTGGQRSERSKWIHLFDNANAIIYVTPLSCYDQCLMEEEDTNAMDETIQLFGEVLNNKHFSNNRTLMILFLTKLDLFELKIEEVSLTKWAKEYNGEFGDLDNAIEYITNKHLEQNNHKNRKIYVHLLCGVNMEQVKNIFDNVQKIIVNNAFTKNGNLV